MMSRLQDGVNMYEHQRLGLDGAAPACVVRITFARCAHSRVQAVVAATAPLLRRMFSSSRVSTGARSLGTTWYWHGQYYYSSSNTNQLLSPFGSDGVCALECELVARPLSLALAAAIIFWPCVVIARTRAQRVSRATLRPARGPTVRSPPHGAKVFLRTCH